METFEQIVDRCVAKCRDERMLLEEGIAYIMREIAKKLDTLLPTEE
jgi:hypothetical protein